MSSSAPAEARTVVVVGVDFSPSSDLAVREALRITRRDPQGEVHLLHALSESEGGLTEATRIKARERMLDELPATLRKVAVDQALALGEGGAPPTFGVHVRIGAPARALVQLSVDVGATLLVVGTHGRGPIGRLMLGSVSQNLVQIARCPVLVVRAQDYAGVKPTDELEPPCTTCVAERLKSEGATWWCEVHARKHVGTHVYSSTGGGWAKHDSQVAATGVDRPAG